MPRDGMRYFLLTILVAFVLTQGAFAGSKCFEYGPEVRLQGHVVLRTFYGPPGYGENPKTDSRETQAILKLDRPICTEANPREYEDAEENQKEVTLIPPSGMGFSKLVGRSVSVNGTLFHSHTGHHHTAVLIDVKRITEDSH